MSDERWQRRLDRQRRRVDLLEEAVESRTRGLYQANLSLERANADLEGRVERRTKALRVALRLTEARDVQLTEERSRLEARVAERTTELRVANAHLIAASRAKDEFLASMSHELRTPLNVVLTMSELIQEGVYGPLNERLDRSVGMVAESGRHLLTLINDLLDLAKVGAGTLELSVESVDLTQVCNASLRFISEAAQKRGLQVTLSIDARVTRIMMDERRLKQILVNLLNNAVKFTPEGGALGLDVTGNVEENTINLSVWDTGIGISEEDQSRLFMPFVQLDAGLDRKYEGTGLGLSLVSRMTERLGGTVHLESSGRAQGSRFTVSFPWVDAMSASSSNLPNREVPADAPLIPVTESAVCSRPLVLLAEDNEANIISMTDFVRANGYGIVVARDGEEAIELTLEKRPDLILMDVQMPRLDGLEATLRIRKDPACAQVPIIALSALAMSGDRERCLAAGASAYMAKPVCLKDLWVTIQRLLGERGAN